MLAGTFLRGHPRRFCFLCHFFTFCRPPPSSSSIHYIHRDKHPPSPSCAQVPSIHPLSSSIYISEQQNKTKKRAVVVETHRFGVVGTQSQAISLLPLSPYSLSVFPVPLPASFSFSCSRHGQGIDKKRSRRTHFVCPLVAHVYAYVCVRAYVGVCGCECECERHPLDYYHNTWNCILLHVHPHTYLTNHAYVQLNKGLFLLYSLDCHFLTNVHSSTWMLLGSQMGPQNKKKKGDRIYIAFVLVHHCCYKLAIATTTTLTLCLLAHIPYETSFLSSHILLYLSGIEKRSGR